MKDHPLQIAAGERDPGRRVNIIREYLQAMILRSMHAAGAFLSLSFVGGTALRFVHGVRRFSEDLDLSAEGEETPNISRFAERIERDLARQGFEVTTSRKSSGAVEAIWVRTARLLYQAGADSNPRRKLSVKAEIDMNPPDGAHTETRIIRRHVMFTVRHHDLPSLMAGKINALLTRPYTKGRDWYDLVWYLSIRSPVSPNLDLLRNALLQSGNAANAESWPGELISRLDKLDAHSIRSDIEPFLEDREEVALLDLEGIRTMLEERSQT